MFRKLAVLLLALAGTAQAATTATVTPGDWPLYRGTSIVSRHASLDACVEAAKALAVTRSYTCRTSAGVAVEVTVDPPPPPPPPAVTVTVSANPNPVAAVGASTTLTWASTGAAACTLSALGQSQAVPTSGSLSAPVPQPLTATVICDGVSASVDVTIASAPPPPPPPVDTDGDGFADSVDACPTVAGVAPDGCPVVTPPPPPPPPPPGGGLESGTDGGGDVGDRTHGFEAQGPAQVLGRRQEGPAVVAAREVLVQTRRGEAVEPLGDLPASVGARHRGRRFG